MHISLSHHSAVGIAIPHKLNGQGIECKCGQFYHNRPDGAWDPLAHYTVRSLYLCWGESDRAWGYTPIHCTTKVKERVELYLYSPSQPSWTFIGRHLALTCIKLLKAQVGRTMELDEVTRDVTRWCLKIDFPSSICC